MSESVVIDLVNYKDRVGQRVAEGDYLVRIEDAEMDQSKAGNPMINLWYTILNGEYAGSTLVDRVTITDKALFRVVAFLSALGIPTPKKRFNLNLRQVIGRTMVVTVEDGEPYNGRVKSEVREYRKAPKVEAQPQAQAGGLEDEFEESAAPVAQPAAQQAAPAVREAPLSPAPSDNDIPVEAGEVAPDELDLDDIDI